MRADVRIMDDGGRVMRGQHNGCSLVDFLRGSLPSRICLSILLLSTAATVRGVLLPAQGENENDKETLTGTTCSVKDLSEATGLLSKSLKSAAVFTQSGIIRWLTRRSCCFYDVWRALTTSIHSIQYQMFKQFDYASIQTSHHSHNYILRGSRRKRELKGW